MSSSSLISTETISKWIINADEVEIIKDKVLGKGAFGNVYLGRCRGKDVAVKRLQRQIKPENLKALIAEVDTQSSLLHPNVLLFMGVCPELGNLMIITEYMPNGDLEHLLRTRKDLSPYRVMSLAKDAALGICWLHGAKIIHSDLKLSNLLVDENLRVKVCDFGLSFRTRDKDDWIKGGARGSPLYMSPECLSGQPFNEKSDVYSFGLILWEIYTRKELFPTINTEEELVEAVVKRKERPPIPEHMPASLEVLLKCCWDADPNKRPPMKDVLDSMDRVLVDFAIDDEDARKFWKTNFLGKENVAWADFAKQLADFLGIKADTQSLNFACLRLVLELDPLEKDGQANIEKFGTALRFFSPIINKPPRLMILDLIRETVTKKGFHPRASKRDAEKLLASKPPGTFMLRFSSEAGCFGMSCVSKKGSAKTVLHFRLKYMPGKGFEMDNRIFKTLDNFVEEVKDSYELTEPLECENNPLIAVNYSPYEDKLRNSNK